MEDGRADGSSAIGDGGQAAMSLMPDVCLFVCFIFRLYITVLVLPNIKMNPPQVYMCSPSRTPLPPTSPFHPSMPDVYGTHVCIFEHLKLEVSYVGDLLYSKAAVLISPLSLLGMQSLRHPPDLLRLRFNQVPR